MSDNPFERSPLIGWMVGIYSLAMLSLPVALIWLSADQLIRTNNWYRSAFVIFFYIALILTFAYFCSSPIIQLMTKYSIDGILQPSLFGSKFLHWRDVHEIRNITTGGIILVGSDTKININLFLFKSPHNLLTEIRSRIPESAYPNDSQISREIIRRKRTSAGLSAIASLLFAVLFFVVVKNLYAIVFGFLMAAYALFEIQKWVKLCRAQ